MPVLCLSVAPERVAMRSAVPLAMVVVVVWQPAVVMLRAVKEHHGQWCSVFKHKMCTLHVHILFARASFRYPPRFFTWCMQTKQRC